MTRGLAGILLTGLLLAGCGGGSEDGPAAAKPEGEAVKAEPRTKEAVEATAKEQADRYASGDFKGTWDMWTKAGKAAISRDDYAEMAETCELGGVPLEVSSVRLESDDEAVVRIGLGDITQSYSILYEDGMWRWQPNADSIKTYALGKSGAIKALKADGAC